MPRRLASSMLRPFLAVAAAALLAPAPDAGAADTRAFVFTTDYSTGSLSAVHLDTRAVAPDVAAGICSDARLRFHDGLLYVVNRLGCDNILVLDPANGYAVVRQFSTGNGSNPADIVPVGPNRAYVTRYESADLLIVNPATGAHLGTISLAGFADADGVPEMDRLVRVGDRVFVSIQRLDRNQGFQPTDTSLVAVIDAATDQLVDADPGAPGVQAIRLLGTNPVTGFDWDPTSARLLIGCAGRFGAPDAGIEWIDVAALASGGFAVTGAALGGDVLELAWSRAARSYAVVSDASFTTHLMRWNAGGQALGSLFSPGGFSLGGIALDDRGELYVCRNDFMSPGLYVFATANDSLLAGPLGTGLPPNQVCFDRAANRVAGVAPAAGTARLLPPVPNPALHGTRLRFTIERPARARIEAFDLSGRVVRRIVDREWRSGETSVVWDLRDDAGRRVRPGIYLVRVVLGQDSVKKSDEILRAIRVCVL